MSISDRVYLARAAGKLFQSTYKHNIATLNRKVNYYFRIAAMLFLHTLETKKPRSFILGASCVTNCRRILQHETPIGCPCWATLKLFSNRVIIRHLFLKTCTLFSKHFSLGSIECQLFLVPSVRVELTLSRV